MTDKRLDRAIYKTPYGFRVFLRINGDPHTKRFPPTYTLDALKRWRDDHERLHRKKKKRGTFSQDIDDYLLAVQAMPSYEDRVREIRAWEPAFGSLARWRITSEDVRRQLSEWRANGAAASTCNHRRTALGHLYVVLEGKQAPNPVRDVPPFKEPPPTARGIDVWSALSAIRRVKGFTRTRLLVLLWTGMRPSELMRVQREHVNFEAEYCEVLTGKGGSPRIIHLNKSAVKALRRFFRDGMEGAFSVASMRKCMVRGCKAAGVPVFRVYDLRHTYASAMRRAGADLADVGHQLGHSSARLAKRYAPVVPDKLRTVGESVRRITSDSYQRVKANRNK